MNKLGLSLTMGLTILAQVFVGYGLSILFLVAESWFLTSVIPVYTAENPGGGAVSTALSTGMLGLGAALGVWLVGGAGARLRKIDFDREIVIQNTLVGALLGVIAIVITPATGFSQMLYPLTGALLGYWVGPWVRNLVGGSA
jgi:hypothetical protein